MASSSISKTPTTTNFIKGDLIRNSAYPLTFGVVVRSDWAANGRVPGYVVRCDAAWYRGRALTFIPADLAELLHRDEPVIVVRQDVRVAACDPKAAEITTKLWAAEDSRDTPTKPIAEIYKIERTKAAGDSLAVTAARLGNVLACENETVNTKLAGTVLECGIYDGSISGYLDIKRMQDCHGYVVGSDK